jgi:hypothetical protein
MVNKRTPTVSEARDINIRSVYRNRVSRDGKKTQRMSVFQSGTFILESEGINHAHVEVERSQKCNWF